MSFLARIDALNRVDADNFVPFVVGDVRVGSLRREAARRLAGWPRVFELHADRVALKKEHWSFESRSALLDEVVTGLVEEELLPCRHGERYPVTPTTRDRAVCTIDRAAAPWFGVRAFGQHLNGYLRRGDDLWMWVARRSATKRRFPGRLDQLVAGGVPYDLTLSENLVKECGEEASLPPDLAMRAVPVGTVTYCHQTHQGLKPDVIYCYDLELPAGFVPHPGDGEVESFELWPLERVAATVRDSEEFKPNCALVVIDFLIRHGLVGPSESDYLALCAGLQRPAAPPSQV